MKQSKDIMRLQNLLLKSRKYWDTDVFSPHSQHKMQGTYYLFLIYSVVIILTVNTL